MDRPLLFLLTRSLIVVAAAMATFAGAEVFAADTNGALLAGVPDPPNSTALGAGAIASGGQKASFTTPADPSAVIASYRQTLPGSGWTVTGAGGAGSSHGGGAGLQATNGQRYLSINAGGPAGTTFVNICVWPSKPADDHCG
jgi:hypothetical protein